MLLDPYLQVIRDCDLVLDLIATSTFFFSNEYEASSWYGANTKYFCPAPLFICKYPVNKGENGDTGQGKYGLALLTIKACESSMHA